MQIQKAERRQAKIKMALRGPSGAGKTYSALLLSLGITNDLSKVCLIDTENGSSNLYADLGNYNVLGISQYSPEQYIRAIEIAEAAGMELIIIDSLSHSWQFLLNYHSTLSGNSFINWAKVTPRHMNLVQKILSSPCHVISTMRVKQDYILTQNDKGKTVPTKVGLKSIQRDGIDYEFTIIFDIDSNHMAHCSKDRTSLFTNKEFKIDKSTGAQILQWCLSGVSPHDVKSKVNAAKSMNELSELYKKYVAYYPLLKTDFEGRKLVLTKLHKSQLNGVS